jgi:hypothetical protein
VDSWNAPDCVGAVRANGWVRKNGSDERRYPGHSRVFMCQIVRVAGFAVTTWFEVLSELPVGVMSDAQLMNL